MQACANQQGLLVQIMDIRGKTHNPENQELAKHLSALCEGFDLLRLPRKTDLQVPVRSNRTGGPIATESLTEEVIQTILASRCEWYNLLSGVAADLKETGVESHRLVSFGIGDCVPLMPFNKMGLLVTKSDQSSVESKIEAPRLPSSTEEARSNDIDYPTDAIAIVGAACRLPGVNNMDELWELISSGADQHLEITEERFQIHDTYRGKASGKFAEGRKFYGNFLDRPDRFDNSFFGINPREMANMDPQQRILLELSYEAMESSGYVRSHIREKGDAVGCFIGASFVEYLDNTNAHPPTAYTSTGTIRAFLCGRLSYHFGWTGPAEVIDTACSSSLVAINRAVKAIQGGECSTALAGGVNIITGANNFLDLGRAGFLSPTGQCKPFDKYADGYCRAEGAGLVVLKRLSQAQAEGDHIMAVIASAGTNQGGLSPGITVPDVHAQAQLFQAVLKRSRLQPEHISYVECHGTGTQAGDPLEIASVRSVFGSPSRAVLLHVGSIKGNIGHCETAAGIAGLLKVVSMLEHGAIPPQASHKIWNPKIPPLERDKMTISMSLQAWNAPYLAAMVNSYGAAGSNAALICCQAPKTPRLEKSIATSPENLETELPIILSAHSLPSLRRYRAALAQHLKKLLLTQRPPMLADIAHTLSERRRYHRHRLSFPVRTLEGLVHTLQHDDAALATVEVHSAPKPVILVFGGQSKQTIDLSNGLYVRFLTFRTQLDLCDSILQELGYPSIFPGVFETDQLQDVVVLQTGFVAVQYASAVTWLQAGLEPCALLGHSLGELTALAVSGMLSLRDCLKLVAARATLVRDEWGQDRGAMLAIFANRLEVERILAEADAKGGVEGGGEVGIACYNADTSHVVSGSTDAIASLEARLKNISPPIKTLRVDTSHGFHSHLVEPLIEPLDRIAAALDWKTPEISLQVCRETASDPLPYRPSEHARTPVFFANAVKRLEGRFGSCTWLEAGFNTPIMPMTKRAVGDSEPGGHEFCSMSTGIHESGNGAASNLISSVICKLWQLGVNVSHWGFLSSESLRRHAWLPPYQFDDTSGWLDNIDRAAEFQQLLSERPADVTVATKGTDAESLKQARRPKMVTILGDDERSGESSSENRFVVSVECERFSSIVSGHAVRNRPLCPASVYLECVAMALDILAPNSSTKLRLEFENLDIQAPLGASTRNVEVMLQQITAVPSRWDFVVHSRKSPDSNKRATLHAKGQVATRPPNDGNLAAAFRLVEKQRRTVYGNDAADKIQAKRAYTLFSRVVSYADFLKGMSSVTLYDTEAVAKIKLPPGQPGLGDSTVVSHCDAVLMDNCIQVLGLLMNTSEMVADNEVMVCVGIDKATLTKAREMTDDCAWEVYTTYVPAGISQATGDVFVLVHENKDGGLTSSIAAAFTGCRFTKLPIGRLEKLLDPVNQMHPTHESSDRDQSSKPWQDEIMPTVETHSASDRLTAITAGPKTAKPKPEDDFFLQILQTYTGIPASKIMNDTVLANMGLDSLAATELTSELQSRYGVSLDSTDLTSMTVHQVQQQLGGSDLDHNRPEPIADALSQGSSEPKSHSEVQLEAAQAEDTFLELLADVTGMAKSGMKAQMALEDVGVDSLALTEIVSSLSSSELLSQDDADQITLQSTIAEVSRLFALNTPATTSYSGTTPKSTGPTSTSSGHLGSIPIDALPSIPVSSMSHDPAGARVPTDPVTGLRRCEAHFETAARQHGFQNYWSDAAIHQDRLVLAYIVEAFQQLGVDLAGLHADARIPELRHDPAHARVIQRLWAILEKHHIVVMDGQKQDFRVRGRGTLPTTDSASLHEEFVRQYPAYAVEARLLALTGPSLAACLQGTANPMRLLFGSTKANRLLEEYYGDSPMLATLTDQLVVMIESSLPASFSTPARATSSSLPTLHILEVGAGTGGTTSKLAKRLEELEGKVEIHYTFSDVSSTMVAKANARFASQYPWMSFAKLDLEQPVSHDMKGRFDIILGTNCVHATRDRRAATARIHEMLHEKGFMVLSEVTRIIDWYDLVFGLLEGWWLDTKVPYPLQSAEAWMQVFQNASFRTTAYSQGSSQDATTQQLLVGCKDALLHTESSVQTDYQQHQRTPVRPEKLTVVYKQVGNVPIEADIFIPDASPPATKPMPIALMIHGGGYMMLSRRAIRPAQTGYLLAHGVLPVSLDYRLCPEVNIADGAMTDARDAVVWARTTLPGLMADRRIAIDPTRIVIVGWSTGGHLAMSTAWTLQSIGEPPPRAILSFYAPVDFLAPDVFPRATFGHLPHRFTREQVLAIDASGPCKTNYEVDASAGEAADLGWVRAGDPRSELLLSLFREDSKYGLSLLLNGGGGGRDVGALVARQPSWEDVSRICPAFHVKTGTYKTPTFIIHGDEDEIALYASAVQLHEEMKRQGVSTGFLSVKGGRHIHDLTVRPGSSKWDTEVGPGYEFLFNALRQ